MRKSCSRCEEGQAIVEYGGALVLVALLVAAVLAIGLPTEVANAVSCSVEEVFGSSHGCAQTARAPGVARPRASAAQPVPATAMSINQPCRAPFKCRPQRRGSPPKPAPPARYGAWFYMGDPNYDGTLDLPCPPGYDLHRDLAHAQDFCAWRPYDPSPAQFDEKPGAVTDGRYEFPGTNVPGYKSNVEDTQATTQLIDAGTPSAHWQYFPGGLKQYDDYQRLVQELSRAADIRAKSAADREALMRQIENVAYGRSLEAEPGPGDTADPSEWEDPPEEAP